MHRRDLIRLGVASVAAAALEPGMAASAAPSKPGGVVATVEQWGMFEVPLAGPSSGNPYKEVTSGWNQRSFRQPIQCPPGWRNA